MHERWRSRFISNFRRAIGANVGALFNDPWAILFLFTVFILLAISGSWISDGLFLALFDGRITEGMTMVLISVTILLVLGVAIKNVVTDVHFEVESRKPRNVKVLVLFLSPPGRGQLEIIDEIYKLEDFEGKRLSWEMPVYAIKYHADAGTLEKVEVITFMDTDEQFEKFRDLIGRLFPNSSFSMEAHRVSDSEDVKEMYEVLESIFKELGGKYKDSDIIIDVTGGKKPATIAGVLASVYHFTEVQYVSTTTKEVKSYYVEPAT